MEHKNYSYKQATLELTQSVDEMGNFEAYVAVFDNIDFGGDVILNTAFKADPNKFYPLLADHNTTQALGKFQVMPDSYGLKMVNASFNLTRDPVTNNFMVPMAAEKYANLKNGDISGFSIGYIINKSSKKEVDKKSVKIIEDAELMEGSVVTFPMNDKARLQNIKSIDLSEIDNIREIEGVLKAKGFGKDEAKTIISRVKDIHLKEISAKRDAEAEEVKGRDAETKKEDLPQPNFDALFAEVKNFTTLITNNNDRFKSRI